MSKRTQRSGSLTVSGGVDRLTTDLNAGNVPDLFCTDGIDLHPLISGGWLENLWSYIDADAVLSRDSLVTPLFEAMSFQGGLYTVTGGFTLKTTLALSAVVGDEPGWSIAEMQRFSQDSRTQGMQLLPFKTACSCTLPSWG